eukprot:scaffold394564_cov51-Attheya_sp.AAC.2
MKRRTPVAIARIRRRRSRISWSILLLCHILVGLSLRVASAFVSAKQFSIPKRSSIISQGQYSPTSSYHFCPRGGFSPRVSGGESSSSIASTLQLDISTFDENRNTTVSTNNLPSSSKEEDHDQERMCATTAVKMMGGASDSNNVFVNAWRIRENPVALSILSMTTAMALHFFGYEFARSGSLTLFTSEGTGFSGTSAFPLAMACVSPSSVLLLMLYGRQLDQNGPRTTLRVTSLFSAALLSISGVAIRLLSNSSDAGSLLLSRCIVWVLFVFQNCYATLLYTQYFSFMGSVMTPEQGATWFAAIAGVSSVASTIAAAGLSTLVYKVGVPGLLLAAGVAIILSIIFGDNAYAISEKYGFDPAQELVKKREKANLDKATTKPHETHSNIFVRASDLFTRVPALGALFWEVLSFQSLSSVLNLCFVTKLKESIPNDALRAAWMGKFYAMINGTCGVLQFGLLPLMMKKLDPKWIWRAMPAILVMDYSSRATANELVYVPLDFDSRYVGKEVIGVFGNGIGKSGMSLFLAGLTSAFGNFGMHKLSFLSTTLSMVWLGASFRLSNLLPQKDETDKVKNKAE